jgi:HTH-type transcriptional regulator, transcriptional repressor of NAD biosynthesis genes
LAKTIRVAILGAESTGKTTLCEELKASLQSQSKSIAIVPEALRIFCREKNRVPTKTDQISIMREQAELEVLTEKRGNLTPLDLLLSDCAPLTIAIYSELYFSDLSLYPEAETHHSRYDLSILLARNIGWQQDGIYRESPEAQQRFHQRLKTWLEQSNYPWLEITATGTQRSAQAMSAIIPLLR